jgi:copper resistance protein C
MFRTYAGGLAAAFLLLMVAAVDTPPALAHAIVVDSTPAVDAVMKPDFDVVIRFNSRIDHERSRLSILDDPGATKAVPIAAETRPDLLSAHVTGLAPGHYRLRWQVLAVDGHITRGDIPFTVAN